MPTLVEIIRIIWRYKMDNMLKVSLALGVLAMIVIWVGVALNAQWWLVWLVLTIAQFTTLFIAIKRG